jgi:hypothetical protein
MHDADGGQAAVGLSDDAAGDGLGGAVDAVVHARHLVLPTELAVGAQPDGKGPRAGACRSSFWEGELSMDFRPLNDTERRQLINALRGTHRCRR